MPGVQPRLLPRDTPLSLHKVPSVFASTAESASVEAMDVDVGGDSRDGGEAGDSSGDRGGGGGNASFSEEEEDKLKLSFSAGLKVCINPHSITPTPPPPTPHPPPHTHRISPSQ